MALTNPYFLYPGFPFSGYNDIEIYNEELVRLNEYIKSLTSSISSKVLLHISAGSAAEELYIENRTEINFLWQQLFPQHLQNSKIPVIHIIISNSRMFQDKYIPLFVKNTPELDWDIDNNTIKSKKLNITVKIFYTGMPSKSDYSKLVSALRVRSVFDEEGLRRIEQTNVDREFTNMFYMNLEALFNQVNTYGGFVTFFSFAVFRKDTEKGKFDGYHLFQEIKKLFTDDYKHSKRLLAEWVYRIGFYSVIIFNGDEEIEKKCVCFVTPKSLGKDTIQHNDIHLLKMDSDLKLVLLDNPFKIAHGGCGRDSSDIDINDSNSLYNCLSKIEDDPLFWSSIENVKMKVFNKITQDTNEKQLMTYLDYNEDYKMFNFNKYRDYICSDGRSEIGQKMREILGIPRNGMIIDIFEIEALASLCHFNIEIINASHLKIYKTNTDFNKNIKLVYDEMVFKLKDIKFEDNEKNDGKKIKLKYLKNY